MCHLFIKCFCCNKQSKDDDICYEPDEISLPFDEVKKTGKVLENVVEDVIEKKNN